jgi:predicted O-methyltransferase YrrM
MNILDNLAKKYGTDKSSEIHNYCNKYEKYLPFNRYDKLNLMEIGVLNGKSLKTWQEYFYNSNIVGIDINPDCYQYNDRDNRVHVEIGSQFDAQFLTQIKTQYGPFDMILDDGSHINEHVIFSFKQLWDSIKPGGLYVVEDVCTSYWKEYGGERYKKDTMMEYFKGITDEVNFFGETLENFDNVHARREDKLLEQFKTKGYDYIGTQIESINFLNGIIIITKR